MIAGFLHSFAMRPLEGLAYKIKNSQGATSGYLIGALHIRSPANRALDEKILRCFSKSQKLLVELVNPLARNNSLLAIPNEETPSLIYGVDFILSYLALQNNIEIHELETPVFQAMLLNKTIGDDWPQKIAELTSKIDLEPFERAWKNGEEDFFIGMRISCPPEIFPKRDAKMSAAIDQRLQATGHRLCISVGAAHLPGEDGIASKLRELGYSVQQIKYVKKPFYQSASRIWKSFVNQLPALRISY